MGFRYLSDPGLEACVSHRPSNPRTDYPRHSPSVDPHVAESASHPSRCHPNFTPRPWSHRTPCSRPTMDRYLAYCSHGPHDDPPIGHRHLQWHPTVPALDVSTSQQYTPLGPPPHFGSLDPSTHSSYPAVDRQSPDPERGPDPTDLHERLDWRRHKHLPQRWGIPRSSVWSLEPSGHPLDSATRRRKCDRCQRHDRSAVERNLPVGLDGSLLPAIALVRHTHSAIAPTDSVRGPPMPLSRCF